MVRRSKPLLLCAGTLASFPAFSQIDASGEWAPRLQNQPFLTEFAAKHGLSLEAVRGGAEPTYPEYRLKLSKSSSVATRTDSQTH